MSLLSSAWNAITYPLRRLHYGQSSASGLESGISNIDKESLINKYRGSYSLNNGQAATDSFDVWNNSRIQNAEALSAIKGPDDKPITDKIHEKSTNEDCLFVLRDLNEVFAMQPTTQQAMADFKKNLDAANRYITDEHSAYHPGDFAQYLTEERNKALTAIKQQYDWEFKALETKFKNPDFTNALKQSLGITTDKPVDAIQASMKNALEEEKKKTVAEFEKGINEHIKKLHESAQTERSRINFIATLYENNQNMKRIIDHLNAERRDAEASIEFDKKTGRATFKGISIDDIIKMNGFLESTTGRKIERAADGTFSMQLPNRFFSAGYYSDGGLGLNRRATDFLCLASAVRSCGYPKITMSVSHSDPEHAEELARQAYQACRDAGYDDKDITIKVNDKAMKADEIFKKEPSLLRAIDSSAKRNQETRESSDSRRSAQAFRQAVEVIRDTAAPPAPAAAAPAAAGPSARSN